MTQSAHSPRDKTDLFVSFTLLALQGFGGVTTAPDIYRYLIDDLSKSSG